MSKNKIRVTVLLAVFIAALFVSDRVINHGADREEARMPNATLPMISFDVGGTESNFLPGHRKEMAVSARRGPAVPADDAGKIYLRVHDYGREVTQLRYGLSTLDGETTFAEETVSVADEMSRSGSGKSVLTQMANGADSEHTMAGQAIGAELRESHVSARVTNGAAWEHTVSGQATGADFRESSVSAQVTNGAAPEHTVAVQETGTELRESHVSAREVNADFGKAAVSTQVTNADSGEAAVSEKSPRTYEIDLARLISDTETQGNREFILTVLLTVSGEGKLYYYARAVLTHGTAFAERFNFVKKLHEDILTKRDGEAASYWETLEEDESSLAHVTIHSDMEYVTWRGVTPKVADPVRYTVCEVKEAYSTVLLEYRLDLKEDGEKTSCRVREFFKVGGGGDGSELYLLSYDREADELPDLKTAVTGKGINLGLTPGEPTYMTNGEGSAVAFIKAGKLWHYDSKKHEMAAVFGFADANDKDPRHLFDGHRIRIWSVADSGDVTFAVYGYMNRGNHEGESGAAVYRYDAGKHTVTEAAFIPKNDTAAAVEADLGQLLYYGAKDNLLYLVTSDGLASADLKNDGELKIVTPISGKYAVSEDGRIMAFHKRNDASDVTVLDLRDGSSHAVKAAKGERIVPIGFIGDDFVCGFAKNEDAGQMPDGESSAAMYKLEILSPNGKVVGAYSPDRELVLSAKVADNRISLKLGVLDGDTYAETSEDYMDSSERSEKAVTVSPYDTDFTGVGQRLIFAEGLRKRKIKVPGEIRLDISEAVTFDSSEGIFSRDNDAQTYAVYALGKIVEVYEEAGDAVKEASRDGGVVISPKLGTVWDDGERDAWYRNFKIGAFKADRGVSPLAACLNQVFAYVGTEGDAAEELGRKSALEVLSDHCGHEAVRFTSCDVKDMRCLIGNGIPVIALTGRDGAVLLTGYDASTVTYIDPTDGNVKLKEFSKVDSLLEGGGGTFLAYVMQ